MPRMKKKDVKQERDRMLKLQRGICPLCGKKIASQEAVLDHCHITGRVRGVLHNSCNRAEGLIAKAIYRSRCDNAREDLACFVENLALYWRADYTENLIHPTHLFPEEKKLKAAQKYQKNLKTEAAKQKKQKEIDELKEVIAELLKII